MKTDTNTDTDIDLDSPHPPPGDPRTRSDFQPRCYPKANGREAPSPKAPGRHDRVMLRFLAVYYEMNLAYAALEETRQSAPASQRQALERKWLQEIERFLVMRDSLEDQCAPLGVIAEPVVRGGVTVDVEFSFGNVDAGGRRRSEGYTITACVPIPMAQGTKLEDLPIQIEGPGIYRE